MSIECTGCHKGIRMCYNVPCKGTPEEFMKIMDAGFAMNLQLDTTFDDVELLCGSIYKLDDEKYVNNLSEYSTKDQTQYPYKTEHYGGKKAPWWPRGKCSLLTADNQCSLHSLGLKPEQGRDSCCKDDLCKGQDNRYYMKLWDTEEGKQAINRWKELVNYN